MRWGGAGGGQREVAGCEGRLQGVKGRPGAFREVGAEGGQPEHFSWRLTPEGT